MEDSNLDKLFEVTPNPKREFRGITPSISSAIKGIFDSVERSQFPKAPKFPLGISSDRAIAELGKAFANALAHVYGPQIGREYLYRTQPKKRAPRAANARIREIRGLSPTQKILAGGAKWLLDHRWSPSGWCNWVVYFWPIISGKQEPPPLHWALSEKTMANNAARYESTAARRPWGNDVVIYPTPSKEFELLREKVYETALKFQRYEIDEQQTLLELSGRCISGLVTQARAVEMERWHDLVSRARNWEWIWS